ncbi:DUF885 domain-containing protein [Hymenobacter sp. BT188]|uniref:DUF885 domain-containing protein n=1 Tax=Hymenobacter sp. BT188 TaxID=2763504 RepID=UPI0016510272|nr:DUF885 domain-containing protein [Hymenobacter sp. BT188]MBC6606752.1 DUF885 domain-containing protein [Hymenobacter sp. BT188]
MKSPFLTALVAFALISPAVAQKAKPVTTKAAANSQAASSSSSAPLAALFEAYSEEEVQLDPILATSRGDNRYNDQFPNSRTQAYRTLERSFYQRYRTQLQKFDRTRLNPTDQVSYDMFAYTLDQRLASFAFNNWMMPFNQFGGLPSSLVQLGSGTGAQPFKTVQDYDKWLSRLQNFPVWADSAIGNFRRGMRAGVVLPKALVPKMVSQLRAVAGADPAKNLFYGPVKTFPASFSAADKARLTPLFEQAIRRDVVAPYQRLADFLETEYLPQARSSSGIGALPQGAARYAYAVQVATTTNSTPEQIYQTGLTEVARITAEMERVKAKTGFTGDLKGYFAFINTDPKFRPFKTEKEVIAAFEAIQTRIAPTLPKLFSRTPKTAFEVRATEGFRAASASAQYNRGTPDGSRPGIFYVPILDPLKYNTVANPAMETLFLHEAIPGHHYQVSLQQENMALPRFRRFGGYGVFSEGWALYTESLGPELGVFQDPNQLMGHLGAEIHRAIRLVVDVGLHTGKLTREQAIAYMQANEAITEQGATAEVERYMASPGQALSYKTGQLKISELRARYEKQLGSKFDLRAFHDEILAGGSMPLAVLEKTMDAWAAKQK